MPENKSEVNIWMPINLGDYFKHHHHFDAVRHGACFCLMAHFWLYGSLPEDRKELLTISRIPPSKWANGILDDVLSIWATYTATYTDKLRQKAQQNKAKCSESGKKGAEARWRTPCSKDGSSTSTSSIVQDLSTSTKKLVRTQIAPSPVVEGFVCVRSSEAELESARAILTKRGYNPSILTNCLRILDDWLDGDTTEGKKAKKQATHYKRLYADWVVEKALKMNNNGKFVQSGGQETSSNINTALRARSEKTFQEIKQRETEYEHLTPEQRQSNIVRFQELQQGLLRGIKRVG